MVRLFKIFAAKGKIQIVHFSLKGVINKHYNFSGKADAFASVKSVNAKSLNKGFIGLRGI